MKHINIYVYIYKTKIYINYFFLIKIFFGRGIVVELVLGTVDDKGLNWVTKGGKGRER